jgi:hypothetical protein
MIVLLPFVMVAQFAAQQPATTTPPPGAMQAPATTPQPFAPRKDGPLSILQGFNIVLLVGESQSSGASIEDVPPAARKALADMKDFLPFKHYRVLDSQWTSCCAETSRNSIAGRVQGVVATVGGSGQGGSGGSEMRLMPRTYTFMLQVTPNGPRLNVYFSLQPEGPVRSGQAANVSAAREQELERRLFELRKEAETLEDEIALRGRAAKQDNTAQKEQKEVDLSVLNAQRRRVQQRIAETTNELTRGNAHAADTDRSSRSLIDSNFTMDIGETVVVGTSRLGGDKALIAIVTAARKGGSSNR